ncbi:MAG: NAD-dependent epimerase/dehydratase family protein, partial [Lachnospiraceae bacterium]|nr:NAD-dependent epimerase/dehydratase family protein [Lachnospiraceae bacterium]
LPDLVRKLKAGEQISLSSGRQNWDYLDAGDAAECIIALYERGHDGEIYNIANGAYRPLREFVEEAKAILNSHAEIHYGEDPTPFVSLQPSVEKTKRDTGWAPVVSFAEGLRSYDI